MVTETKVKYPGYVFAKLRLCPKPYEAIQDLDLCRSWMGTVNRKGHKKLPPIPLALNEIEVENFGLEDLPEEFDDEPEPDSSERAVIMDSEEDDDDDDESSYEEPMYKNIDRKALKKFKGLKVEDMVKVVGKGKFFNEDGIVRRLKEDKIFVRFYTYGTMFEEWMDPSDLRKLSPEELLRGLTGPSLPITQRDFDGPEDHIQRTSSQDRPIRDRPNTDRPLRTVFQSGDQRNRRQDRLADRFKDGRDSAERQSREGDKNWSWYKEQQNQQTSNRGNDRTYSDNEYRMRPGSERNRDTNGAWAESDVDSQWGRKPERQVRKETRKTNHQLSNSQTKAAIDGKADWSAFVTSNRKNEGDPAATVDTSSSANDFFASLMSDLSKDLGSSTSTRDFDEISTRQKQQPNKQSSRVGSPGPGTTSDDDFFASLMTELSNEASLSNKQQLPNAQRTGSAAVDRVDDSSLRQDDDFFALLEADLGKALSENSQTRDEDPARQLLPEQSTSKQSTFLGPKESAPAATQLYNESNLDKKTVPVLKGMLKERGLKVGGNKAELVERLLQQ